MSKKTSLIISVALIALGIAGRLLPHLWNMTPLVAIALFASVYLRPRYSLTVLFVIMSATDLFIGFYQWQIMLAVYGSFAAAIAIGLMIKKHKKPATIFFGALGSSILFFVVTNWAVWQFGTMYDHSIGGLMQSYFMGIPFFKNALMGDLLYTGLLFSAYEVCLLMPKIVLGKSIREASGVSAS